MSTQALIKQKKELASMSSGVSKSPTAIEGQVLPSVILTRPIGKSKDLIQALSEYGLEVIECPLFRLSAIESRQPLQQFWANIEHYALVIFVSPNAIDYTWASQPAAQQMPLLASSLPVSKVHWPLNVPIGVMGPGSIAALAHHGMHCPPYQVIAPATVGAINAVSASGHTAHYDSEAFALALEKALGWEALRTRPVLIVRGSQGREWLSEYLRAQGVQVESLCAYQYHPLVPSKEEWSALCRLLDQEAHNPLPCWVITSSGSMRHLDACARRQLTAHHYARFRQQTIIATHARVAACAQALGFSKVVSASADNASIIQAVLQ
jgi:uroporphyrinogen III methyltransferase/synthase